MPKQQSYLQRAGRLQTRTGSHAQVKPGLRVAVEPHGGHFWSTQGQKQQPMDVMTLRIDNQERMANELNAVEISPTSYMLAFLKQRGWQLPNATVVIPNVIADGKSSAAAVKVCWHATPHFDAGLQTSWLLALMLASQCRPDVMTVSCSLLMGIGVPYAMSLL